MRLYFVLFTMLLTTLPAFAQKDNIGAWYIYFSTANFKNSRFGYDLETQFRNYNIDGDLMQWLTRGGVKYNFLPKLSGTLGYAYILSESENHPDNPTKENRIYQEALFKHSFWIVNLRHRGRIEQRFIEGRDFNMRYRYCLFADVPLNHKTMQKGTLYAALYDEVFVNGIHTADTRGFFDRNRFYAGLGYKIISNLGVQLGWMRQSTPHNYSDQLLLSLHHQLSF